MRFAGVLAAVFVSAAVTGCSGAPPVLQKVELSGRLLLEPGDPVAAAHPRPIAGTIIVAGRPGVVTLTLAVGSDGRYSARVWPGVYDVFGSSPDFDSGAICKAYPAPVVIPASARFKAVDVVCAGS